MRITEVVRKLAESPENRKLAQIWQVMPGDPKATLSPQKVTQVNRLVQSMDRRVAAAGRQLLKEVMRSGEVKTAKAASTAFLAETQRQMPFYTALSQGRVRIQTR